MKGKSQILVINKVRVLGSGPHTPTQFFGEYPPPGGNTRILLLYRPYVEGAMA